MNGRCPVCNKSISVRSDEKADKSATAPFCSERCKFVDLGAWLDEEYKIAVRPGSEENEGTYQFARTNDPAS